MHPEDAPSRPSEETLLARAEEDRKFRDVDFQQFLWKVEEYNMKQNNRTMVYLVFSSKANQQWAFSSYANAMSFLKDKFLQETQGMKEMRDFAQWMVKGSYTMSTSVLDEGK